MPIATYYSLTKTTSVAITKRSAMSLVAGLFLQLLHALSQFSNVSTNSLSLCSLVFACFRTAFFILHRFEFPPFQFSRRWRFRFATHPPLPIARVFLHYSVEFCHSFTNFTSSNKTCLSPAKNCNWLLRYHYEHHNAGMFFS